MQPYLISKIDLRNLPKSNKMILGDLDGDGRLEMIMLQANGDIDDRYVPHQLTHLTALDITGKVLWTYGEPIPEGQKIGNTGSDYPAQIYDIDGDGENEVLCVMDKKFLVLEGKTGKLKKKYDLPSENAHDCIILANFSGADKPRNVVLKDRYKNIWAMDADFNMMWTFNGNVGHFPYPYDIDNDGFDELMAGYTMLDRNGKVLFRVDQTEHADCIFFGNMTGNPDNGVQIVVGGGTTGLYDRFGNELYRYDGAVETQHIAIGRFIAGSKQAQVACLDRIVRGGPSARDAIFMLDDKMNLKWKEDRKTVGWLTIVESIKNWDDSGLDRILAYRRGGGIMPTIYDADLNEISVFPLEGYVSHGSVFGDGREEVIIYTPQEIQIFSAIERDVNHKSNIPVKQTKRLFSATLYPGGELDEQ